MDAVIFDVDGTLWDTTDLVAQAWNIGADELGIVGPEKITGERLKREFGKPMDIIVKNLFPEETLEVREELLKVCCIHEHRILRENQKSLLYPGVRQVFQELSKTHKVCIVSNCQVGYIELFLETNGLGEYVTDFESFGNTRLTKGENIQLVLERQKLQDACYVGDTKGDYEASRFAGLPFVFASYGFGQVEHPDWTISHMEEVLRIVG